MFNHHLQTYLRSNSIRLTAFRASVVYSFSNDDESWAILEWVDTDGTQAMGIFVADVYDDPTTCSWLIHLANSEPDGVHGTGTRICWDVTDISVLKRLFQGAQHALGLLQMPMEDALKLYSQEHIEDPTSEEYAEINSFLIIRLRKYARLLYNHFRQMEQLNSSFDRVAPFCEEISSQEGILPP